MPRQILSLGPFVGGVAPQAGGGAPLGLAEDGSGFDPQAAPGRLLGHRRHVAVADVATMTGPLSVIEGRGYLAVAQDDNVRFIYPSGGTFDDADVAVDGLEAETATGGFRMSGSAHGAEVRLGSAAYGAFRADFNNGAPTAGDATLYRPRYYDVVDGTYGIQGDAPVYAVRRTATLTLAKTAGSFEPSTMIQWLVSFVYGAQEGPLAVLSFDTSSGGTAEVETWVAADEIGSGVAFTFSLNDSAGGTVDAINRITSVNVYRQTRTGDLLNEPVLLKSISPDDFALSGGALVALVRDDGLQGVGFEANAGFPYTLETLRVRYRLSAHVAGYHVVGDVKVNGENGEADLLDLGDGARAMVLCSLPYQPDVLDWVNRWVRLPEAVVAIVEHRGRAFCFGERNCYVVDPGSVTMVETLTAFSAAGPTSVAVSDRGVVSVGFDGRLRYFDGNGVRDLSEIIGPEWLSDLIQPDTVVVGHDAQNGRFFVTGKTLDNEDEQTVVLRPEAGADAVWVSEGDNFGTPYAITTGLDGRTWMFAANGVKAMFESATRASATWLSRPIRLPGSRAKIYRIDVVTTNQNAPGALFPEIHWNGVSDTWEAAVIDGTTYRFKVPPAFREADVFRVLLSFGQTTEISNVEIVYRPIGPHIDS